MVDFPVHLDPSEGPNFQAGRSFHRDLRAGVRWWHEPGESHSFLGYALFWADTQSTVESRWLYVVVKREPETCGRFLALWFPSQTGSPSLALDTESEDDMPESLARRTVVLERFPAHREAADVDFVVDDFGVHPWVHVQSPSHALQSEPLDGAYRPAAYENWVNRNWLEQSEKSKGSPYPNGKFSKTPGGGSGIILHFEGASELIQERKMRGQGKIKHHWEVIGYELYPMQELLDVYDTPRPNHLFNAQGHFVSSGAAHPAELPPWLQVDGTGTLVRSQAFDDPATAFAPLFRTLRQ